jgi:hypothetical protein
MEEHAKLGCCRSSFVFRTFTINPTALMMAARGDSSARAYAGYQESGEISGCEGRQGRYYCPAEEEVVVVSRRGSFV